MRPIASQALDRPVWSALTGRQREHAAGDARAVRFAPDINLLGAAADESPESQAALAALIPPGQVLGIVEPGPIPLPPGTVLRREAVLWQMAAEQLLRPPRPLDFVALGDADAPEMLALATLTEPGPFLARTHRLGAFVGVRREGRLVAMAGERMRVPGFTEVSAVCTHPDHRGQGLAGALMGVVIERILARDETPFLHSYATNAAAIALYESLGFRKRREVTFAIVERV